MSTEDREQEVAEVIMVIWASAVATQNIGWHTQYLKDLMDATDVVSRMRVDVAFDRQTEMLRDIGAVIATTEEIYQKANDIVESHGPTERFGPATIYGHSLVDKSKIIPNKRLL